MPKYLDKYPLNANITIDYEKQRVDFSYNGDKHSFFERFKWVFSSFFQMAYICLMIPMFTMCLCLQLYFENFMSVTRYTEAMLVGICFASAFINSNSAFATSSGSGPFLTRS